jgi:hypothetical protein
LRSMMGLLLATAMGLCAGTARAQAAESPAPPAGEFPPLALRPPSPPDDAAAQTSPPPAPAIAPRTRRRTGLLVAGAVLDGVGIIGLVVGVELMIAGSQEKCVSLYSACRTEAGTRTAGIGALIGGGALLALGTPLLVMGVRKVPAQSSVEPTVLVGASRCALRWSF